MTTTVLTYDGLAIRVNATADELVWLGEFMAPAFASAGPGSVSVTAILEEGLVNDAAPTFGSPVAFALDSGPLRYPASRIPGGVRLRDPKYAFEFDVRDEGTRATLRYETPREDARFRLMRVVREYAHNHALGTGGLVLHASAIVVDGVAIVIAGPKGAGKTTTALGLVAAQGVDLLANDRVLVRGGARPMATAVPTLVAIREGTRHVLPELAAKLAMAGDFRLTLAERGAVGSGRSRRVGDVWYSTPADVARAAGRSLRKDAPLAAVLFLDSGRDGPLSLTRMREREAGVALTDVLLCRGTGAYMSDVFIAGSMHRPDDVDIHRRCHALAGAVPCLVGGFAADGSARDAEVFLQAIIHATRP